MKKLIAVLMICLLSVSVFGCGGGSGKGSDDAAVIKIGGIGPLTGDYATYGVSVKNGAQIAVDEINEAGGVNGFKFELLFEDDQADPEKAVNAYAKLIDDGMNVSLGCVTSGACVAVTEEIKKDGLLMLTPSGSQLECTQYDNCFRVCFQDPDQGKYSADFIKEKNVGTKVAIIYDKSNPYSVGIYDSFIAEAEAVGLEVVTSQAFTDQSNTDFSVQLQAVKGSGADLLFLPIYARKRHTSLPRLTPSIWMSSSSEWTAWTVSSRRSAKTTSLSQRASCSLPPSQRIPRTRRSSTSSQSTGQHTT